MRKTISTLLVASQLLFGGINNHETINFQELDQIPLSDLTRTIANEFAKNLPLQIDALTVMTQILGIDNRVISTKQINITDPKIQSLWKNNHNQLIQAMYKIDSQVICNTPIWKYLIMQRDVIVVLNYQDTQHRPLFDYTVESADCQKIYP